jgi:hypothetical protein
MPDVMDAHTPARPVRNFFLYTWHNRHRIIRSMAGGFIMYLFLDVFFPVLDGIPFRLDGADLILWLSFGFVIGILNVFESDARMPAKASDFRHHG